MDSCLVTTSRKSTGSAKKNLVDDDDKEDVPLSLSSAPAVKGSTESLMYDTLFVFRVWIEGFLTMKWDEGAELVFHSDRNDDTEQRQLRRIQTLTYLFVFLHARQYNYLFPLPATDFSHGHPSSNIFFSRYAPR